jgi:hypothetical protein
MNKTILFSALLLAVALGGPITMFRLSDFWRDLTQGTFWGRSSANSGEMAEALNAAEKSPEPSGPTPRSPTLSLEGMPTPALDEVLRFDVSPAWVLQRWPRVSTDLAHLQLHGYRVPLVTGTSETDVAGSLTYYFNPAQQVQHITLKGTTGDARALIALLSNRFGYVRRPNNDPSRLVFEAVNEQGKSLGSMVIQSAPVVRAYQPYQRYNIDLTMDRPK